jgi:hypothetical protein
MLCVSIAALLYRITGEMMYAFHVQLERKRIDLQLNSADAAVEISTQPAGVSGVIRSVRG